MKTALITGVTGQDGSYLAEFLLAKGYRVVGMVRRSSTENFERIEQIRDRIELRQADLLDQLSLVELLKDVRPDEVYNLAAQSFVPTSWVQPVLTAEFDAVGVTRMLEAVRLVAPQARFYQASSSEMFGQVREVPQRETTPFYPRSPYGVAKVYGHHITVNYRESYGLFACSGILFNHESVTAQTPVIVRRRGLLDLVAIADLLPVPADGRHHVQFSFLPGECEVWDGSRFTPVVGGSAYPGDVNKRLCRVVATGAVIEATPEHVVLCAGRDKRAGELQPGERLAMVALPDPPASVAVSAELAWFLGAFVARGAARGGKKGVRACFAHREGAVRRRVAELWKRLALGDVREAGGSARAGSWRIVLDGSPHMAAWLLAHCYTRSGRRRVPDLVLNADRAAWREFLAGYRAAAGGKGTATRSAVLAMGIYWLASQSGEGPLALYVDARRRPWHCVYRVDLPAGCEERGLAAAMGGAGLPVQRWGDGVVEAVEELPCSGWLYDLTTTTGTFHAGVGRAHVHNSPRRGLEFVTRKVTAAAAAIKLGRASELRLGNLEARRDWGFAGDYVEAMWLMLQQDQPDDYVVATGEAHSVRELVEIAFEYVGLDWRKHVRQDPLLLRPAEVEHLVGDASKARARLGWRPRVSFRELVEMMVAADLARLGGGGR